MVKFTLSVLLFATAAAGAQSVSLGNTSSSVNGNITTITLPVTVAVPASAATVSGSSTLNALRVEAGTGYGLSTNQTAGNSFQTVTLGSVVTDTGSGWNASANSYTVPASGTYLIVSGFRLADNVPAGISYGQGVHTSNVDNPAFLWATTVGTRNGTTNTRIMQLSAGQTLTFFAYIDSPSPLGVSGASLSIQQIQ